MSEELLRNLSVFLIRDICTIVVQYCCPEGLTASLYLDGYIRVVRNRPHTAAPEISAFRVGRVTPEMKLYCFAGRIYVFEENNLYSVVREYTWGGKRTGRWVIAIQRFVGIMAPKILVTQHHLCTASRCEFVINKYDLSDKKYPARTALVLEDFQSRVITGMTLRGHELIMFHRNYILSLDLLRSSRWSDIVTGNDRPKRSFAVPAMSNSVLLASFTAAEFLLLLFGMLYHKNRDGMVMVYKKKKLIGKWILPSEQR